ncbi:SWIM zinc finger family protein [Streptomyces sp. NPDC050508]|uniref:SWIM zinc finger family protein n=1 Tax=Streptomyces sp. NPDC050508 TaxID=3155405 RepID=UPI00341EC5ED
MARQALRAAREHRERVGEERPVGHTTDPGEPVAHPPVASEPERSAPRSGDSARAALRSTLSARDTSARPIEDTPAGARKNKPAGEEGAAPGPVGGAGAKERPAERGGDPADTAPDAPDAVQDRRDARPADVAREALRAARREAQRAQTDAAARQAGPATRSPRTAAGHVETRPAPRSPRPAANAPRTRAQEPDSVEAGRARAVRDLLADAFRMPTEVGSPEDLPGDNDPVSQLSSGVRTPARTDPEEPVRPPMPAQPPTTPPSTTPRTPASMASPSRDSDLRRTFPALSPRPSDGDSRFAETWWGNAWVTALEEGALDPKRLLRGRSYAEKGHVDAITVTPGLVLAYVQGSRPRPYRVQVRLRTLDDGDWERFLDAAADRPGHIAALLDKEMPKSLAESGVRLLPGPGDLEPHCSCPDSGHPCKHAAALCYQTARLLDADPFVLLLLRGRGERPLLDALSRRSAARAARAAQEQEPAPLPGVRATEALAERRLPPLPPPLPVPPHPGQPPAYPAAPGGPDPFALDQLATDAATRAHALLSTGRDPVGELTLWQDAVRLAAARPGSGLTATTRSLYASLAKATRRTPAELARAVAAWRQGGIEGLAVLEEPWDPPAGRFDRARPLLLAADLPAFRPRHNHLTHPHGHVQLRLGRDGLWYAYESEPGHDDWWPRGTPDLDPVGALTGLGSPGEL